MRTILTKSQQSALETFKEFLKKPEQVFILKGAAGTGKTTLLCAMIELVKGTTPQIRLMAPTGRAAFIMGERTRREALTIHKTIYSLNHHRSLAEDDEEDSDLHLTFGLKKIDDSMRSIYFIDEASMISDTISDSETFQFGSGRLLKDLFSFANGRKMVFIGDYAQLPPVNMSFSPALDSEYLEQEYNCKTCEFKLTEVIRQNEGSGILNNATRIRDGIENNRFNNFQIIDGDDVHRVEVDLLKPYIEISPVKPSWESGIISYSNKKVAEYNNLVREYYFGIDPQRLLKGDLLMIYRNNYAYEEELFNGTIVSVIECQSDDEVETRSVRVKRKKDTIENVNLSFRKVTILLNTATANTTLNVCILDNFLDESDASPIGLLTQALRVDFNNRMPSELKSNLSKIKHALRRIDTINDPKLARLVEAYLELLCKDPYYNCVIAKYGYSFTCHKAQGGEWKNVFIDMGRFGSPYCEDYFRWAYTAFTRATENVWHFRSPNFSYISNLIVKPIQKSSNLKLSSYCQNGDFCNERFERINRLAIKQCVNVLEDKTRDYQHWITFANNSESATFSLWYGKDGYTGKETLIKTSNEEFSGLCRNILTESFAPRDIPFNAQDRPFAVELNKHIKSLTEQYDIHILDIVQKPYLDTYHLQTNGFAKIELRYDGKGRYSSLSPISTLGVDDEKLKGLCDQFK